MPLVGPAAALPIGSVINLAARSRSPATRAAVMRSWSENAHFDGASCLKCFLRLFKRGLDNEPTALGLT